MSESSQDAIDKINQLANQSAPPAPSPDQQVNQAAGAAAMASGSQALLNQIQSGGLTLDPETGQALINTLNKQIARLTDSGEFVNQIQRQTKLGMTPGGQAIAKFNQEVASTGGKAFVPVHRQFLQTLSNMVEAIQTAMDNYAQTEDDNAHTLKPKD